jgi:hypothetical protein
MTQRCNIQLGLVIAKGHMVASVKRKRCIGRYLEQMWQWLSKCSHGMVQDMLVPLWVNCCDVCQEPQTREDDCVLKAVISGVVIQAPNARGELVTTINHITGTNNIGKLGLQVLKLIN